MAAKPPYNAGLNRDLVTAPGLTPAQKGGLGTAGLAALAAILVGVYHDEGGYVNNKADRGGETNWGVTARVARADGYLGSMRDYPKNCYGGSLQCADKVYVTQYIAGPGYLPLITIEPVIADKLINQGVNMGPPRGSAWLQSALNASVPAKLTVDGKVGPATTAKYQQLQQNVGKVRACQITFDALVTAQKAFYQGIVARNPSQRVFLNGWMARAPRGHREMCGQGHL